jgi:hypothetical protein
LIRAADGLQHRARLTFGAWRGLPYNILDAKLYEGSQSGIVEIQDWLIKLGTRAENPTQDFLMLLVGDDLRKQGNQRTANFRTMIIQTPVGGGNTIRAR